VPSDTSNPPPAVYPFRSNYTDANLLVNCQLGLTKTDTHLVSSSANFILCSVHMNVFLVINVLRTLFYAFEAHLYYTLVQIFTNYNFY